MNYFETTYLTTPLVGAFGGGLAVQSRSDWVSVSGMVVGLLVGLAVLAGMRWVGGAIADRFNVEAQNRHPWLNALVFFLLPLALPVVASELAWIMVTAVFRL